MPTSADDAVPGSVWVVPAEHNKYGFSLSLTVMVKLHQLSGEDALPSDIE
jgi:hypothetical protein